MDKMDKKALLNVKEMCEYLGIGQTKARELLSDPKNNFTIRIGKCCVYVFAIYTKRHAEFWRKRTLD